MDPHETQSSTTGAAAQSAARERASVAEANERSEEPQREARAVREEETADEVHLLAENDAADLRKRWSDVQAGFVDEPQRAVKEADSLVADVTKRLTDGFTSARRNLEKEWDRGGDVTTEDLRLVLRRYRLFFDRLLTV